MPKIPEDIFAFMDSFPRNIAEVERELGIKIRPACLADGSAAVKLLSPSEGVQRNLEDALTDDNHPVSKVYGRFFKELLAMPLIFETGNYAGHTAPAPSMR